MALAPEGTSLWRTGWHNLAPRLGVAYIVRDGRFETVLRGGVGIFYDTAQQPGSYGFLGGVGFIGFNVPTGALSFPIASLSTPPAIVNPPVPPYGSVYAFPRNLQLPYTWQSNVSIEQALGKSQTVMLSYVGAFGRKLIQQNGLDVGRVNPDFGSVTFFQNGLTSDYNSLQVRYQRSLSHGLQVLASYTLSHCLDYGSANIAFPYQRGNCDFDVRNNFSAAASYNTPSLEKNNMVRAFLGGWSIDDRFTARTAFPVNLNGPCVYVPGTTQYQCLGLDIKPGEPIYVSGAECAPVYNNGLGCPGGRAINPNAFTLPAGCTSLYNCPSGATRGDAPRNFARGFGAWQMDLAVRREFPIQERLKLQFRAEAFNVFNHPSFGYINSYYGQGLFGQASATLAQSLGVLSPLYQMGGPRSMQFALKLVF
jgi:hypothetical protein